MVEINERVKRVLSEIIEINENIRQALFEKPHINHKNFLEEANERHAQLYKPLTDVFDSLLYEDIICIEAIMVAGKNGSEYYEDAGLSDFEIFQEELDNLKDYEDNSTNREQAISYITEKTFELSNYLRNGIALLNIDLN